MRFNTPQVMKVSMNKQQYITRNHKTALKLSYVLKQTFWERDIAFNQKFKLKNRNQPKKKKELQEKEMKKQSAELRKEMEGKN